MCGVAGFCLTPEEHINARELARHLLLGIESRGKNATGMSWYKEDGSLWVCKAPTPATYFVPHIDLPGKTRNVLLHTRAATQGDPSDNENNHPVTHHGVVGIHNGIIWNDDNLYKKLGCQWHSEERNPDGCRRGLVDSEAIFAAIAHGMEVRQGDKAIIADNIPEILEAIKGSAAIAWQYVDGDPTEMFLARISGGGSPLVWGQTKQGSFIFASTKYALEQACKKVDVELEHIVDTDPGTYMRVKDGRIIEAATFESGTSTSYSCAGGGRNSDTFRRGSQSVPVSTTSKSTDSTTKESSKSEPKKGSKAVVPWTPQTPEEQAWADVLAWEYPDSDFAIAAKADDDEVVADNQGETEDEDDAELVRPDRPADLENKARFPTQHDDIYEALLDAFGPTTLGRLTEQEHDHEYWHRVKDIEHYVDTNMARLDAEDAVEMLDDMGYDLRVGDWVRCSIGNLTDLAGQIFLMPNDNFPDAEYVIRVEVRDGRYPNGRMPILVSLRYDEFTVIPINGGAGRLAADTGFDEEEPDLTDDDAPPDDDTIAALDIIDGVVQLPDGTSVDSENYDMTCFGLLT